MQGVGTTNEMIRWQAEKKQRGTFSSSTVKLIKSLPKDILNTVNSYQFKKQQSQFIEISLPRLLNLQITFITKEFAKLWIAGSWENMPRNHHCILALLLRLPQASCTWLMLKIRYRIDGFYHPSKNASEVWRRLLKISVLVLFIVVSGLAQRHQMDPWQSLMPQRMPLSMNDFILGGRTVLKSAGILSPPEMEAGSYLMLPESQGSSTRDTSSFPLLTEYSAWNAREAFIAQRFVASSSAQHRGNSLRTTGLHTKTAYKNVLSQSLWNWSATVTLIDTSALF